MSEFNREDRYIVLKLNRLPKDEVEYLRDCHPKAMVECVVVEHDWPEYQLVWTMIEHRMAGKPVPNFNDWRRADELQQRLTTADERADMLEGLVRKTLEYFTESGMPEDLLAEFKAALATSASICTWQYGAFSWHTGCGTEWMLNDGTPEQNGMRFCHSCGKTLVVEGEGDE